jgi:hypothetical protein
MYSAQKLAATSTKPTPSGSEERDTGDRDTDAREVDGTAREDGREHERAEELDRDGRPERDAGERGVEEPVHACEGQTEPRDGDPLLFRPGAYLWADRDDEHDRRDGQSERRHAPGAELREELHREGRAELQRYAGSDDEGDRGADGSAGARGRHHGSILRQHVSLIQRMFLNNIHKEN